MRPTKPKLMPMEFNGFTLEINEVTRLVFNRPVNILSTPVVTALIRALGLLQESEDIKGLCTRCAADCELEYAE